MTAMPPSRERVVIVGPWKAPARPPPPPEPRLDRRKRVALAVFATFAALGLGVVVALFSDPSEIGSGGGGKSEGEESTEDVSPFQRTNAPSDAPDEGSAWFSTSGKAAGSGKR